MVLVGTLFSLNLVGILDPFSLLYRSFAVGFMPAIAHTANSFITILYQVNWTSLGDSLVQIFELLDVNSTFIQGFFLGTLFLGLILLNMTRERFWCRYLCPLGAFLGLAARWNILKLRVDQEKCIECGLCTRQCQTQANPFPNEEWKSSECDYCFTCSAICPTACYSIPAAGKAGKHEGHKSGSTQGAVDNICRRPGRALFPPLSRPNPVLGKTHPASGGAA